MTDNKRLAPRSHSDEQPTAAAFVRITTTPEGPTLSMAMPGGQSERLLGTVTIICGIAGSMAGPYLMAKALREAGAEAPWLLRAGLLAMAALLPMVHALLGRRRN